VRHSFGYVMVTEVSRLQLAVEIASRARRLAHRGLGLHLERNGSQLMMTPSDKDANPPHRPEPPWLAGAMIGLSIATLATGAMMLGAGLAVGQIVTRGK